MYPENPDLPVVQPQAVLGVADSYNAPVLIMKNHFGQTVASQDLLAVSMDVTSRHATVLHTQV